MAMAFTFKFNFTCSCGNKEPANFYLMPAEGLREDNTFGFLDSVFRIVCKRCNEEFVAEVKIRRFVDAKK